MKQARIAELEQGVTGVMRKVLDAVPAAEGWPNHRVAAEMNRVTGSTPDMRSVGHCLKELVGRGLIKETKEGFSRVVAGRPADDAVGPAPPPPAPPAPAAGAPLKVVGAAPAAPATEDPVRALGELAGQLRALQAALGRCADAIDSAALAADERIVAAGKGGAVLAQLRQLLSGDGG